MPKLNDQFSASLQSQQNIKALLGLVSRHPASKLLNCPVIPSESLSLSDLQNSDMTKLEFFTLKPLMERMFTKSAESIDKIQKDVVTILDKRK